MGVIFGLQIGVLFCSMFLFCIFRLSQLGQMCGLLRQKRLSLPRGMRECAKTSRSQRDHPVWLVLSAFVGEQFKPSLRCFLLWFFCFFRLCFRFAWLCFSLLLCLAFALPAPVSPARCLSLHVCALPPQLLQCDFVCPVLSSGARPVLRSCSTPGLAAVMHLHPHAYEPACHLCGSTLAL